MHAVNNQRYAPDLQAHALRSTKAIHHELPKTTRGSAPQVEHAQVLQLRDGPGAARADAREGQVQRAQ